MRALFTKCVILAFASTLLSSGCGSDGVELRVDVRTDWVPVAEFSEIEISLDGESETVIYDAAFEDDFLTGVRVATLEDVKPGTVTVRARILAADGRRLVQRLVAAEVTSNSTLTLVITRSCEAVTCPDGDPNATECVGGRCVSPECSPENPDACGEGGCESDDDCGAAPVGCARTICTAGECFVGSDFSACATSEFCHPELGCQPRPVEADSGMPTDGGMSMTDGGPTDMGPPEECGMPCDTGNECEVGVYECSTGEPICVRDSLVAAGTTCREAVGQCDVAEECDGENPTCPMDAFTPTGQTCSLGFCDGLGTCSDSCTPGADCSTGNPCETGTIDCSGGTPSCTRSGNAPNGTSCGTTENGPFGSCGGFSSTCDETGTRSRTVTRYECAGGSCQAMPEADTESCSRSTGGTMCGSTMTTGWSTCGGFSGTCDETGTQSRMVTTYTCASASCDADVTMESQSCSRSTNGSSCGSVTYGSWGSCGSYSNSCDETGSRSRSVFTPTCSSGTCSTVTTSENGSCSRDTDGDSCGSVTYGSWSSCGGFSGTCDETGSRSRNVNTPTCASGSCGTVTTTQNGSCTRDTDGDGCGTVTYGPWSSCSYSDGCDETGTRTRNVYTPTCGSGSCDMVTTTQNGSCSRNTDGQTCLGVPFGCNDYRCASGTCRALYRCTAGQICCEDLCTEFACP